ncbi:MAG: DMT family transporter [Paracoccus sp. (in: a-proteobacteria)]|nr:DMT family transporter [Paracoccus sp. (in: a-proteobacteria)]
MRFTRPELALVTITAIWGVTFLAVETAMSFSGPMGFVGLRFGVAALMLGLCSMGVLRGLTRRELVAGGVIGLSICAGYGLQTAGVAEVGASRSAFITALYVPIVPLLQWLVLRRPPRWAAWAGIVLAFAGLLLVAGPGGAEGGWGRGEWLTLGCAVAIAGEILLIGAFAGQVDSRRVTVVQLGVASAAAFAVMGAVGEGWPPSSWQLWALVLSLGLASALIQLVMNWAQRTVSPARATVIYAGEPVWAALFGRLAGERLPALALLGGVLIVAGVLVSEMKPRKRR